MTMAFYNLRLSKMEPAALEDPGVEVGPSHAPDMFVRLVVSPGDSVGKWNGYRAQGHGTSLERRQVVVAGRRPGLRQPIHELRGIALTLASDSSARIGRLAAGVNTPAIR